MIGLLRVFLWRRLRWLAIGGVSRWLLRKATARSVDQATVEVEQRLPAPVRRVIEAGSKRLPVDPVRTGGSALVAGRAARRASKLATETAGQAAAIGRQAGDLRHRVTDRFDAVRSIGSDFERETETARRELTSRYRRATEGNAAGDDALLDLRPIDLGPLEDDTRSVADGFDQADPLDLVPGPVRPGRRRAVRRRHRPEVPRVQRSYRPRRMPWDR